MKIKIGYYIMSLRKFILRFNPINRCILYYYRKKIRQNITIFSSNCMGGMLYHDCGLKFLSPTVNTRFDTPDFIKFVCNIDYYLSQKLQFIETSNSFPVALLDDVKIYFVHYLSKEEAEQKWIERVKRIDWKNIFVITNDNDGVTDEELTLLDNCPFQNILVFTANQMLWHRCTFNLRKFNGEKEVGNTMLRNIFTGEMPVQQEFDFISWFNQTKGTQLENYRRK